MSGSGVHTRASGKPTAKPPSAPTPATPHVGKKDNKQDTIDRLRAQRDVLLAKKSAAAAVEAQLREEATTLHRQLLEARNAPQGTADQAAITSMAARVSAMQTAAERV